MHLMACQEFQLFGFFALFIIASLTPFISELDSSRDLTIYMISSISPFEIISAVAYDPIFFFFYYYFFYWIATFGIATSVIVPNLF